MELVSRLSTALLTEHPLDAAILLEDLAPAKAAAVLCEGPPDVAGVVVQHLSPLALVPVTNEIDAERLATILAHLDRDRLTGILRALPDDRRALVLDSLPAARARDQRALLKHPADSAGGLMDPEVAALPDDWSVENARKRVREEPARVRYNIYLVDRGGRLVGVINLRELMIADAKSTLREIMNPATHRVRASATAAEILAHPGWRTVHSLPVVDAGGVYLGAIRYRILRRLEGEARGRVEQLDPSTRALADLFSTGTQALFGSIAGARRGR
jgi:magnesium transporter